METSFQFARGTNPISLSQTYILPEEKRPNLSKVATLSSIPIIDLSSDEHDHNGKLHSDSMLVHKISQACEDYGFFQIKNHGIPQDLSKNTMKVIEDFFKLPSQERAQFFATDHYKKVELVNYHLKAQDQDQENVTMMWSEAFKHPWDFNGDFATFLPENPPELREVYAEFAREMGKLMKRLLGLISQGLGLESDFLERKIGQDPILKAQANYYPTCPDPDLTLGLPAHTDLNAITVLMQSEEVSGLQVIKDDNWVSVEPIPNVFVVNLGDQLQVLSNGRYKSVHHRVVTNKIKPRVSLAMFYEPNADTLISPIEELIDEEHPPIYRSYKFSEFLEEFERQAGTRRRVKEVFELRN